MYLSKLFHVYNAKQNQSEVLEILLAEASALVAENTNCHKRLGCGGCKKYKITWMDKITFRPPETLQEW